jgi:hypothetical protein
MKYFSKLIYILSLATILSFVSCDDLLDVGLPGNIIEQDVVFTNAENIKSAVIGLYSENLVSNPVYYYMLPLYLSIVSDESYHNLTSNTAFEDLRYNTYSPTNAYVGYLWEYPYASIFLSNDLVERIAETNVIPEDLKQHYIGEAKYFRAYGYFILVNLFGDVPWVKSSNVLETGLQPRESKEKIINDPDGIIDDLKYAETALDGSANSNAWVTKQAASALLARVYLYEKDWENAEAKADDVIKTSGYELETALENVFLRSSKETIFKISSANASPSYLNRTYFSVLSLNASYFRLTTDFVDSFEGNDLRKEKWLKNEGAYFHSYKYKRNSATAAGDAEDLVLLRLAEQYLIRAEARAQQNKLTGANGAIADINAIRSRAGLAGLPQTLSKAEALLAIEKERRHELFLEEGHRWWDLVRTGRADAVLGAFSGKQWAPYKALLPVPSEEIDKNRNLTPNPGYGDI